jgi:uncharacterized membrane protein YGL010W
MAKPGRDLATRTDSDWTVQTADTVERVVDSIRSKSTVPLTTVARGLVYGLLAAFAGLTALVLLAILLVRAVDLATGEENVWIAHLIIGTLFLLAGVVLWRKRKPVEQG